MKAIVYTSQTGFTRKYAELLAGKVGVPAYTLKEAAKLLSRGSEVFYMGWILAGELQGLSLAVNRYTVRGAALVGMSPNGNGELWTEARINGGTSDDGGRIFYLQGGYAPEKLKFFQRFFMKRMGAAVARQIRQKGSAATETDLRMLEMFQKGGDCVREEHLEEIVRWFVEEPHEGQLKLAVTVEI